MSDEYDDLPWISWTVHEVNVGREVYRIEESSDFYADRVSVFRGRECIGSGPSLDSAKQYVAEQARLKKKR